MIISCIIILLTEWNSNNKTWS